MKREYADLALAAGHSWAERRAEVLQGNLAAVEWPDAWEGSARLTLPFTRAEVTDEEWVALLSVAAHSAKQRWSELVEEQRALESPDEEQTELEIPAAALEAALGDSLPSGFMITRDGARLFLRNLHTGEEEDVVSLESAWRVVSEWQEHLVDHHRNIE